MMAHESPNFSLREWLSQRRLGRIRLSSDCLFVRGVANSALYDLSRSDVELITTAYLDFFESISGFLGSQLEDMVPILEKGHVDFIEYMIENEYMMCDNLVISFDNYYNFASPGMINNAIIDYDEIVHDLGDFLQKLSILGCRYLQIRCYSTLLSSESISDILRLIDKTEIISLEIIIKFCQFREISYYKRIVDHPRVSNIIIHSTPDEFIDGEGFISRDNIRFVRDVILSEANCGVINLKYINPPTREIVSELMQYNGCLHKKISVDKRGLVRSCPSMKSNFGHFREISLHEILSNYEFRRWWTVKKDDISICNRCEFRYLCTDCRAYTIYHEGGFGKPLKCGFDPLSGIWKESV